MTTEAAFLQDIIEHPDDAPRLVFADWLDERGGPDDADRAEFIRLQCELARLAEEGPGRPAREAREQELLTAHGKRWLGPLGKWVSAPVWRRGFPEEVAVGVRKFLDHGEEIFRLAPLRAVKLLRLNQTSNGPADVAACPLLEKLRGLDLQGSLLGDEGLAALLGSPYLGHVEELRLSQCLAGDRALANLARGPFKRLRRLDLSHNALGARLEVLFGEPLPFRLEHLDLADTGLNAATTASLASWPGLASVRELILNNNAIRVAGAQALARSPHLASLTTLDLAYCHIGVGGAGALAASAALANIVALRLNGADITSTGLEALLESPHLGRWQGLYLSSNGLGDRGVEMLAAWPGLARHTVLQLRNNNLGPAAAGALAVSPQAENLQELNLSENMILDAGAEALAASPHLRRLRGLSLAYCGLRDAGARALLSSSHLQGLQRLLWNGNSLSAACGRELAKRFPADLP
jgi:uncharacterized protein (TIGR02996 family)